MMLAKVCTAAVVFVTSVFGSNSLVTNDPRNEDLDRVEQVPPHAAKDFKLAEFYERNGHKGTAVLHYELIVRRYPGTTYAKEAAKRCDAILKKIEKEESTTAIRISLSEPATHYIASKS